MHSQYSRDCSERVTWCTFGTVLCDEEPQRRTVGEDCLPKARPVQDQRQGQLGGKFLPWYQFWQGDICKYVNCGDSQTWFSTC